MRWSSFVSYCLAGVFLTNSVPHLLVAATGRRNLTPFGRHSSPFVNLLWGALNMGSGYLLVRVADRRKGLFDASSTAWQLPYELGCLALALFGVAYSWRNAGSRRRVGGQHAT